MKKSDTNLAYIFGIDKKQDNISLPQNNSLRTASNHGNQEKIVFSAANSATKSKDKFKYALEGRPGSFDFSQSDKTKDIECAAGRPSTSRSMNHFSFSLADIPSEIQVIKLDTIKNTIPAEDSSQLFPTYTPNETYSLLKPSPICVDISDYSPIFEDKHQPSYSMLNPLPICEDILEDSKINPVASIYEYSSDDSLLLEDNHQPTYSMLDPVEIYEDISEDSVILEDNYQPTYSIYEPTYSILDTFQKDGVVSDGSPVLENKHQLTYTTLAPASIYDEFSEDSSLIKRKLKYYSDESSHLTAPMDEEPNNFPRMETDNKTEYSTLNPDPINKELSDFPGLEEGNEATCSTSNPVPMHEYVMDNRLGACVSSILENVSKPSLKNMDITPKRPLYTPDIQIKQDNAPFSTNINSVENGERHALTSTASSHLYITRKVKDISTNEEDISHNRDSVIEYYNTTKQQWRSTATILGTVLKDMREQFRSAQYLLNNDPCNAEESINDLRSHVKELISIFHRLKNTIRRTQKLGKVCSIQRKRIQESYFRSCSTPGLDNLSSRKQSLILGLLGNLKKIKSSMKKNQESIAAYDKCKSKIVCFLQK